MMGVVYHRGGGFGAGKVETGAMGGYNGGESNPYPGAGKLANQTGKRYVCAQCKAEFVVTKGGAGSVACCGEPMQLK